MQENKDEKILKTASNARVFDLIDTETALAKTKQRLGMDSSDNVRKLPIRSMLRVAASVMVAATIGLAIYLNQTAIRWTTVVATESIKEIKLPDGSVVTLNKDASLSYAQNITDQRLLKLEGEAFFDIQRDESRPFIINSGNAQIKVLGTSFNVSSSSSHVEVSVASGLVLLSENDNEANGLLLKKNQAARFDHQSMEASSITLDQNYLGWKTNVYTFKNTSVKEALLTLAKHHGITLEFDESVSDQCTISSTFNRAGWDEITREFEMLYSLDFYSKANVVIVKGGKRCE